MDYPVCYDPVIQEERRQKAWDDFVDDLPVCKLCGHSVYPGDRYHETYASVVCSSCMDELRENECILEAP